ncbi:hypothetical protein A8U91_02000 [Halomonas elongata]|uniref:Uncharacterized protein n=1 Tax=Halomonas elongata TaxID=2746 RepID=A0A1B8P5T3_HALEL|nr:hypothetical protein A8U91_02000 [Halomonas elongata]
MSDALNALVDLLALEPWKRTFFEAAARIWDCRNCSVARYLAKPSRRRPTP